MKNDEKVVNKFIKTSINYGIAIEKGDSKKANRQSKIIREIRKELFENNNINILEPLFENENEYVLLNVASSLISVFPDKSIFILERLCSKKGLFAVEAQVFLNEWKNVNIKY